MGLLTSYRWTWNILQCSRWMMFWWLAVVTYRSPLQKNCQHQLNKFFSWWMLEGQNPTKYRLAPWIILVATGHWFLSIQQVLLLPYQLLRIAIELEGSCFIYCNNYLWSSAHVSQVVCWNCWRPCWYKWFCWFHSPPKCLKTSPCKRFVGQQWQYCQLLL